MLIHRRAMHGGAHGAATAEGDVAQRPRPIHATDKKINARIHIGRGCLEFVRAVESNGEFARRGIRGRNLSDAEQFFPVRVGGSAALGMFVADNPNAVGACDGGSICGDVACGT